MPQDLFVDSGPVFAKMVQHQNWGRCMKGRIYSEDKCPLCGGIYYLTKNEVVCFAEGTPRLPLRINSLFGWKIYHQALQSLSRCRAIFDGPKV